MKVADAGTALGKRTRSRITAIALVSILALVAAVGFGRSNDHPWRLGRLSEPRRVFLAAVFRWVASSCLLIEYSNWRVSLFLEVPACEVMGRAQYLDTLNSCLDHGAKNAVF